MLKKVVLLLLSLLLIITLLAGCSNDEQLQQIENLQSQIDKLKEENLDKDKKIEELTAAYTAKMAELEANKQANADAIAKLKAEHKAELEANKQANADAIAKLEAENANLELQIAELEARIEELLNDKDYIVTFDVNGGEGSFEDQTVRYKNTVNEPTAPTKAHYDFLGWYVDGVKAEFPYVVTTNTDFIAEYAPTKYTITYNVNGGEMPESYVSEYNVETAVTLPVPSRDRCFFEGWYENANFRGEKVTEISIGEFGNRSFYAKWLAPTNDITYQLSDDGAYYTVIGYYGIDTVILIPSNVRGIPVTKIAYQAFRGERRITSIIIPDSVTSIGDQAFYGCSSLTSVVIGDSVTSIGANAFNGCYSLTSVEIPNSVTSVGDNAFFGCSSLTSVVIGDSVTSIGANVFNGCSSLVSVEIPDSVTSVGDNAFNGCSSLMSVKIPDSVTSIGSYAFNGCSSLASVKIPDSVTSVGDNAFFGCYSLTSVAIGNSVTSIGDNAFSRCGSLTSVVIGDSVTSIGVDAFYYCESLTSVEIPDSVTSIGYNAFDLCSSLYVVYNNSNLLIELGSKNNGYVAYYAKLLFDHGEVTYANDGYNYTLTDDGFLFREKNSKYNLIAYIGGADTVTLPANINGNAYNLYCMRGVINVIIPDSVTSIGDYAFCSCESLTSVVIPDSVTFIGDYALDGCESFGEVYYNGKEEDWVKISISKDNSSLEYDARYYYSEGQPEQKGNFWHYVDGVPTKW